MRFPCAKLPPHPAIHRPGLASRRRASGRDRFLRARALLAAVLLLGGGLVHASGPTPFEARRIDYLIASIERLPDAEFVRNGTSYSAAAAADHLRLKLRNAGTRVATAEDFIRLCASSSSMSGERYLIRFADGRVVTSEAFLRARLLELSH